jgi:hypothetical protein
MTLKINRTVFIAANSGFIYYVKLDDGNLIKKFQIELKPK